jgi:probable phosphoglycerate mutase
MTILLARHGETDDNRPPVRVLGTRDTRLNGTGRRQAAALGERVRGSGIAALYCSHLARAHETAEIVAAALGLEPRVDARLAESDRGEWEGRLLDELALAEPAAFAAWRRAGARFRFPGGESLGEQAARVLAALDDVRAGPLPALVVCHGGTIRAALCSASGRGLDAFHEWEIENGTVIEL